jgi:uncharacterized protein YceH (UPF0502 family)
MRPKNRALYSAFIQSRALGESIAAFCKRVGAPKGTCERWSRSEELREAVDIIHSRWDDQFVARNARQLAKAQANIHKLGDVGTFADSVRLRANERVIDDRLNARFRKLERDVAAIRARKKARDATKLSGA